MAAAVVVTSSTGDEYVVGADGRLARRARTATRGGGALGGVLGAGAARGGAARARCAVDLPARGYPDSVREEYALYQACDTAQALCSYLRGVLTTKAILGVGRSGTPPSTSRPRPRSMRDASAWSARCSSRGASARASTST